MLLSLSPLFVVLVVVVHCRPGDLFGVQPCLSHSHACHSTNTSLYRPSPPSYPLLLCPFTQAGEGSVVGKLSCPMICASMGRSVQLVALALNKLAGAARDNAERSRSTAKAALEEAAQVKPGAAGAAAGAAPAAGGSPANYVPAAVQAELPNALKALRVAEMAQAAARALPAAGDIPIADTNAAKQLADTVKAVESATKAAQRSVDDLVKAAVSALVGGAALSRDAGFARSCLDCSSPAPR